MASYVAVSPAFPMHRAPQISKTQFAAAQVPTMTLQYLQAKPHQTSLQPSVAAVAAPFPPLMAAPAVPHYVASLVTAASVAPKQKPIVVALQTKGPAPQFAPVVSSRAVAMVAKAELASAVESPATAQAGLDPSWIPHCYEEFGGPYAAILDFIKRNGLTQALPRDRHGVFQTSVPFCGNFIEFTILLPWLKDCFGSSNVVGTDLICKETAKWNDRMAWATKNVPDVSLELRRSDLSQESLPPAGLIIGIHPEATKGGPWHEIIAKLVQNARETGGLLVLATFFDFEMRTVTAMLLKNGCEPQVFENPYYLGREKPSSPWMQYIIICRPGQPGVLLPGHLEAVDAKPEWNTFENGVLTDMRR